MSDPNATIEYRDCLPTAAEFERLFRSTGWTEANDVSADRLAAALPASWYAVTAFVEDECVGTGMVLSDGILHALIVNLIVLPEWRKHGIGTEMMKRLVQRCREAEIVQIELFSARGKRSFYEGLGFVARPDDGPGMELRDPR